MTAIAELLVATDLSARSERAVRRAIRLARAHGLPMTVVNAVDDALPDDMAGGIATAAHARVQQFLDAHAGDLDTRVEIVVGDPTSALVAACQAHPKALLILGSHRPRGFLGELRETTAQRVVRLSRLSALIVVDPDDHDYRTAILAADFSPATDASVTLAQRIAPGVVLHACHAIHVPYAGMMSQHGASDTVALAFMNEAEATAKAWAARHTDDVASVEVKVAPPVALLRDQQTRRAADLVIAGAHGRAGMVSSFLGSVVTDLMRDPPCDLLVVRP